jgi:hypothetical protein
VTALRGIGTRPDRRYRAPMIATVPLTQTTAMRGPERIGRGPATAGRAIRTATRRTDLNWLPSPGSPRVLPATPKNTRDATSGLTPGAGHTIHALLPQPNRP